MGSSGQQLPDLVSHDGEEIHSQVTGADGHFAQSLSSVSVQEDPELRPRPVHGFDPVTDLLDRLTRTEPRSLTWRWTHI